MVAMLTLRKRTATFFVAMKMFTLNIASVFFLSH